MTNRCVCSTRGGFRLDAVWQVCAGQAILVVVKLPGIPKASLGYTWMDPMKNRYPAGVSGEVQHAPLPRS